MNQIARAASAEPSQPSETSPIIAIVGDDAQDILALAARLQALGMDYTLVEPPSDLLGLVEEHGANDDIVIIREPMSQSAILALLQGCANIVPQIPVRTIVLASRNSPENRQRLIKCGAGYVLENTVDEEKLKGVLRAVSKKSEKLEAIQQYVSTHRPAIGKFISGEFEITTLEEAERLSAMFGANTPCPEKVSTGIWEILSNAIEHGNLEIDFDTKTELLESGQFEAEIERRLTQAPYADRVVRVQFERTDSTIHVRVADEGSGFDFEKFINVDLPLGRPNGRGIHIARQICFERVTYHGTGNIVDAVVRF